MDQLELVIPRPPEPAPPEVEWRYCSEEAYETYEQGWKRSRQEDAGVDLRILEAVELSPGETRLTGTGIAINITEETVCAVILPRSGHGLKGLSLGNTMGLIDCGYQGELKLALYNRTQRPLTLEAGERVAQLLFLPVLRPHLTQVRRFEMSPRGARGFGSSGKL